MENSQIQTSIGIVITGAYDYYRKKFYRVYKDGIVRAEVMTEEEAKRIADLLKYEIDERPNKIPTESSKGHN